jgi:hypothetical protein
MHRLGCSLRFVLARLVSESSMWQVRLRFAPFFLLCVSALQVRSTAQDPNVAPPSQSVAPAIITADSGVKTSGTGKSWSDWYQLGTGKAPQGYTVNKVEFWLTGDRSCGEFAECREVQRSDQQVVWEFRLRGDETRGAPKIAFSEGHIRVTYSLR